MRKLHYHIDRSPTCFDRIGLLAKGGPIFCLTDENVSRYCAPILEDVLGEGVDMHYLSLPPGEEQKTIKTCERVWEWLLKSGAERDSMLIALGGGVITDIGGFVASAYQRGIGNIAIPTTLLGMVDAAIGGKNGVDLNGYKNMVGMVRQPDDVLIHPPFLQTLDARQKRAGFAEMLKHGVLESPELFEQVSDLDLENEEALEAVLPDVVEVKRALVERDPEERSGERECLNFGHTVGHALETLSFELGPPLLHGEAVAAGMIVEGFVSEALAGFPGDELDELIGALTARFSMPSLPRDELIVRTMGKDKKRRKGCIRGVLLERIGIAVPGRELREDVLRNAFDRYRKRV
ncbi:MAG: 3-dehydroquinate synthase family protein [Flavobacteriales bacterium]